MEKLRFMLSFLALVLTVSFTAVSCGTNSPSQLQSMTVSPAAADAQSFPNGIVPFVATGVYVNPPRTVTPQPANWAGCQDTIPTPDVSVTAGGAAHCASGATGTFKIAAWDSHSGLPSTCNAATACGAGCNVVGTAQLTCP
jgi:hypothetical protein